MYDWFCYDFQVLLIVPGIRLHTYLDVDVVYLLFVVVGAEWGTPHPYQGYECCYASERSMANVPSWSGSAHTSCVSNRTTTTAVT